MESFDLFRSIAALFFVVSLIVMFAYALKRWGNAEKWLSKAGGSQRLHIIEIRYVDPKHKLVLVRRDNVEHLILVGAQGTQVVESEIKALDVLKDNSQKAQLKVVHAGQ